MYWLNTSLLHSQYVGSTPTDAICWPPNPGTVLPGTRRQEVISCTVCMRCYIDSESGHVECAFAP